LLSFNFDLFYQKGAANAKADTLSRCPVFTFREGGMMAAGKQTMLRKEQWLEVGATQLDETEDGSINIGAMHIKQLLPEAKEWIKEQALLDEEYRTICKQLLSEGNLDSEYNICDEIL
jgi:hypothetical protein